jgi:anaerobic nitric oxide reductase transcription regulator
VTPAALATLRDYDWPGNVRELEHVMLRAALRAATGRAAGAVIIEPWHLDGVGVPATPSIGQWAARPDQPLADAVDDFQRRLIGATLEQAAGNWAETARRLGIDRGNLHRLARRLGLKGQA